MSTFEKSLTENASRFVEMSLQNWSFSSLSSSINRKTEDLTFPYGVSGVVSKVHLCERDRETLGDARRKMRIAQQLQDARDYDDESNGYPLIVANSANLSGSKRRAR